MTLTNVVSPSNAPNLHVPARRVDTAYGLWGSVGRMAGMDSPRTVGGTMYLRTVSPMRMLLYKLCPPVLFARLLISVVPVNVACTCVLAASCTG